MIKPQPKIFHFKKYNFNKKELKITFNYKIEFFNKKDLDFKETILLPSAVKKYSKKEIDSFLKPLHIILGISYYKLYIPSKINIFFKLSKEEADFWNTVYRKGLGEFLYKNKLNPNKLAKFPFSKGNKINNVKLYQSERALLGIGGGKDSISSFEILKGFNKTPFLVETQKEDIISHNVIKKFKKKPIVIKRILDEKIFKKHENSYNGHIPISAIFAFLGILTAYLYDYRYVIVGNEKSSNFGNLKYYKDNINHQWSKSEEFEKLFQNYVKKFITNDILYFSILRRFYEIKIAQIFSKYKEYFNTFSSCNNNFKVFKKRNKENLVKKNNSLWCNNCPKCLFTFLILSPFLEKKELINIFGENLFSKKELIPLFGEILGFKGKKPFDCVGTFKEAQASLFLSSKKFKNDIIVKEYLPKIKIKEKEINDLFNINFTDLTPDFFNFFGLNNVCIIGYGREGKTTQKYLKKYHKNIDISILDKDIDKGYLKKQLNYEYGIKTSGIPKEKIKIPYTTGTNIFFSRNKNFKIGITGTKGKSTTATLIYEILKTAKKDVKLVGNIGIPMHEILLKEERKEDIFVIELSSYMLDDIRYSPDIAALLNLFPEHMDYHKNIKNYYEAKENIFKFQNSFDKKLKFSFKENIPFDINELPSWAKNNLENIKVAIKVSKILNISEKDIKKGIKNFKPLKHRIEFIGNFNGISFYDDAAGTTPESTIKAINSLKNIDTIFLGGEDRGYNFSLLEKTIKKHNIKNLVLFPNTGEKIIKNLKGFNFIKTKSMKEAVKFAFKNTKKNKICLLSTASPSYSLWKNFQEKGEEFQKEVKKYKK